MHLLPGGAGGRGVGGVLEMGLPFHKSFVGKIQLSSSKLRKVSSMTLIYNKMFARDGCLGCLVRRYSLGRSSFLGGEALGGVVLGGLVLLGGVVLGGVAQC